MITPEQIRAARALLRIDQAELARRAQISVTTIRRIEAENGAARVSVTTLGAIRKVLEAAGADFIEGGVRHRRAQRRDRAALYRELRAIAERSAAQLAGSLPFSESDLYDDRGLPV